MTRVLIAVLLAGCATQPETYCKAGYEHTWSSAGGYRQIWSDHGKGVPCRKFPGEIRSQAERAP